MERITQKDLIFEYFEARPYQPIETPEVVDWAVAEYQKRTGKTLRDPDRMIRSLFSDGKLVKLDTGLYQYDPSVSVESVDDGFTPAQRAEIMKRGDYKCAWCGATEAEGVTLHVDHIRPRSRGGKSVVENGQILCGPHNYKKKTYGQTETGKRMFIELRRLAVKESDQALVNFIDDVLQQYAKHGINSHIVWDEE